MSFSSAKLNFLIYCYLKESNYVKSAFVFGQESNIDQPNIDDALEPKDALSAIVNKGVKYIEAELCAAERRGKRNITALALIEAISPSVAKRFKKNNSLDGVKPGGEDNSGRIDSVNGTSATSTSAAVAAAAETVKMKEGPNDEQGSSIITNTITVNLQPNVHHTRNNPILRMHRHAPGGSTGTVREIAQSLVTILRGHEKKVNVCAWNPFNDILASGSVDSTVRIWMNVDRPTSHITLLQNDLRAGDKLPENKDISSISWNSDGKRLATGSYDGLCRIWTVGCRLDKTLSKHTGHVFAIKWNKNDQYIVTASADNTTIVWTSTGRYVQQFAFHTAPVLDVDWMSDDTFASCSKDQQIHVCQIGKVQPLKTFVGHTNEVNHVEWCPTGSLLASGSDDMSVKVWSMEKDTPVHNLAVHQMQISALKWSNTGPGTANPNVNLMLATASYDSTVHLWKMDRGRSLHKLKLKHSGPVFSVAFSPDGRFLATGGTYKCVNICSTQNYQKVIYYKGSSTITDLRWNTKGDRIAAATMDGPVVVLDLR